MKILNYHVDRFDSVLRKDYASIKVKKWNLKTQRLLKKIGQYQKEGLIEFDNILKSEINYSEISIDLNRLGECLAKELYYFRANRNEIELIIIGHKLYSHFVNGDITGFIYLPYTPETARFMGIRILLNPYIDGVVFVPKER